MDELHPIVSVQWLLEQLNNPSIVIVDCRFQLIDPDWGYRQYIAGHIPGAYFLDLNKDLSLPIERHGGRHPLPHLDILAEKLSEIGINSGETEVIIYDDARFAFAARLWWLLRYLGHNRVALLDGGWKAWQSARYPVTTEMTQPKLGKFIPKPRGDWTIDINGVKARQGSSSVILVDSRESDRYLGKREPIDPIAGHIPGAVNSPWQQVTDEDGYLHPLSEQQKLWQSYRQADEIIVYCGSGVTACVNFLSLELSGHRNVKLYPGGWSDWCSYPI